MRIRSGLAALVLALGLVVPASAQSFPGMTPVSQTTRPQSLPMGSFFLWKYLPSITRLSNNRTVGVSNIPTRENMPGGASYLQAFGYHFGGQ